MNGKGAPPAAGRRGAPLEASAARGPAGSGEPANALDRARQPFDPIAYAHCAGVSLILTGIAVTFLAETIALGFLLGNPPAGQTTLVFVIFYFALFVGAGLVGLPRPAIPCIEPLAAMRAFTVWRVVAVVVSAVTWDGRAAEAALWACLLLGAIVDGVCLNRVALAWKTGFRGAAAISLRAALPLRSGGPPPLPEGDGG